MFSAVSSIMQLIDWLVIALFPTTKEKKSTQTIVMDPGLKNNKSAGLFAFFLYPREFRQCNQYLEYLVSD